MKNRDGLRGLKSNAVPTLFENAHLTTETNDHPDLEDGDENAPFERRSPLSESKFLA